ncbi:hypothetical protein RE432_10420 [Pusillimonas sp. SM2304]|uniref:hypothetical protein n=1 Tax=Pusillimonas sp. SM2304 TaxID=3073241 RepID=UPI002874B798|nr:hypothetical protein [Pusillimonas sp. SM2304]MDS1140849.1 hypothetical protein [Pusillimonas sp. SM2304]
MNMLVIRTILPIIAISSMFSGCTIGNGRICGPQTPSAYCDREAYQKLLYPTPSRDYWEKASVSIDGRRKDWMDCGGNVNGGYGISTEDLKGRTTLEAASIKFDDMQYCMMKKGYSYTGTCDGEIPSQYPACKAMNR